MKTVIVDAVGEPCPVPVVKATKALRELGEPGTLEVRVDNEIAVQNLTRMAAGNHLPVQAEKKGEHLFVVTMEVAEPVGDAPAEEPALTCVPDARGRGFRDHGTGQRRTGEAADEELPFCREPVAPAAQDRPVL